MTTPSNNSIFVVGFNPVVTKEDVQAFFEKNLPSTCTISKIAMLKGRSRRVPDQEERQEGVPYSFITFEQEASVQAALELLNKNLSAYPNFANIKIEQVGNKERVNNSLYVTGFKFTNTVQAELKNFFESNLKVKNVEVDVRRTIITKKKTSENDSAQEEQEDKSFAFVFFPNPAAKKTALETLNGAKIGGSTIDIQERAEPKPRARASEDRKPRQRRPAGAASNGGGDKTESTGRGRGRGRGRGSRGSRGGRGGSRGRGESRGRGRASTKSE